MCELVWNVVLKTVEEHFFSGVCEQSVEENDCTEVEEGLLKIV